MLLGLFQCKTFALFYELLHSIAHEFIETVDLLAYKTLFLKKGLDDVPAILLTDFFYTFFHVHIFGSEAFSIIPTAALDCEQRQPGPLLLRRALRWQRHTQGQ